MAVHIANRLRINHSIDSYVDVIDPHEKAGQEDLAEYIRKQMSNCTQLLAVVSQATSSSQWVPWEIGVATEKDLPLATYSGDASLPPEFIRKWPYLRTNVDIDEYARISKQAELSFARDRRAINEGVARSRSTKQFYSSIRAALRQ